MPRLEVRGVTVEGGGGTVLRDVDLSVDGGTVVGLTGRSGSGKTTMCNVICGLHRNHTGRVLLDGHAVHHLRPHHRARLGIARTFKPRQAFGALSVRDNVLAAARARSRCARDGSNPRHAADEVMRQVGLTGVARERLDALPEALRRFVALGPRPGRSAEGAGARRAGRRLGRTRGGRPRRRRGTSGRVRHRGAGGGAVAVVDQRLHPGARARPGAAVRQRRPRRGDGRPPDRCRDTGRRMAPLADVTSSSAARPSISPDRRTGGPFHPRWRSPSKTA